jgi:hypothetical protein
MSLAPYRGRVANGQIILDETELPDGTEVEVWPVEERPGSPAALLRAMERAPQATADDVAELLRLIEEGRCRPSSPDPFGSEAE